MSDAPAIVVALNREFRCVRSAFPRASAAERSAWRVSGIGPKRAATAAGALLERGHRALACIGLAGGLNPALGSGDVVIASAVVDDAGERLVPDVGWRTRAIDRLRDRVPVHLGDVHSVSSVVADATAKHALYRASGAMAVDMETAAVVRVANAHAARVLALRVVADEQTFSLSRALLDLVDAEGNVALGGAWSRFLTSPRLTANALRLAARVRRAERRLTDALSVLGPDLACPSSPGCVN